VHQKYSKILFSRINKLVTQPAKKAKFSLGFLTLFIGLAAGNHAATAQTVGANRPLSDRLLAAHQQRETQLSGSKNFNMPNRLIARSEQDPCENIRGKDRDEDRDEDRSEDRGEYRGEYRHKGGHHKGEHNKDEQHEGDKKPKKVKPSPNIKEMPNCR
jgi:hypothetical protein